MHWHMGYFPWTHKLCVFLYTHTDNIVFVLTKHNSMHMYNPVVIRIMYVLASDTKF